MKKLLSVLAIIMVCTICVACLTGCGDRTLDGKYKTLEAYLADPTVQSTLAESMDTGTDSISVDIVAEGSLLVYVFTYNDTYDDATKELVKSSLESSISSLDSTYEDIANSLKDVVASNDLGVVIRYSDASGAVIFEKTYMAD